MSRNLSRHGWTNRSLAAGPQTWCWLPCWATTIFTPCSPAPLALATGRHRPGQARPATETQLTGVYLRSIEVEGFRGIGPRATLRLKPGPGLTVVAGRNGSGTSSLAEAAELVLTNDNKRWSGRTQVWRDGWRNLHTTGDSRIGVELTADGQAGVVSPANGRRTSAWKVLSPWFSRPVRGDGRLPR
jgi:AAA domain